MDVHLIKSKRKRERERCKWYVYDAHDQTERS